MLRIALAYVAGVIGVGLVIRGVGDWGLGFGVVAVLVLWGFRARRPRQR